MLRALGDIDGGSSEEERHSPRAKGVKAGGSNPPPRPKFNDKESFAV